MYALIDLTRTRKSRGARHYETLPDGRIIVPISELRAFGTTSNVDIVATATELKQLIEWQNGQTFTPDPPSDDTATQEGGSNGDTQQDVSTGDTQQGGSTGDTQDNLPPAADEEAGTTDKTEVDTAEKGDRL